MSGDKLKVFKVETNVIYWAQATSGAEAMGMIVEIEPDEEGEEYDATEVGREGWPKTYYDDGEGKKMPFADLVAKNGPGVLTCSEWP